MIAAALMVAVALCVESAPAAALLPVRVEMSDVIIGTGSAGPYALTWNNIAPASERIVVNGVPLLRGIDYTIDWTKGTVTFARPLAGSSAAHITYLRQPGRSQLNQQPLDLPAAIPLGALGEADLSLALRLQHQPSQAPLGVYGLRAGHRGATQAEAALFFSETGAAPGRADAAGDRALAWRIGAQRSYRELDLAASLVRAEAGFSAPKDLPASAGMETLNLSTNYRPWRAVSAKASLTASESLSDSAPAMTRTAEYGLALKPMSGAEVTLTRRQVASAQAPDASAQTTDQVQANLTWGSATRASAAYQRTQGGAGWSEAQSLRVASNLGQGLSLVASHSRGESQAARQEASDAALEVAAWRQARLRATLGARRGDEVMDYRGVEAALKPAPGLSLEAAYKQRDLGADDLDTRRAAVAWAMASRVEIGGEYAQNPENERGVASPATSTKLRVATRLGVVGLSGSLMRQVATGGDEQRAGEVRLTLALAAAHSLYSAYRQIETMPLGASPAAATKTYLLGYSYALGSDFSLALEGQVESSRDYQALRTNTEERADAKLNWRF